MRDPERDPTLQHIPAGQRAAARERNYRIAHAQSAGDRLGTILAAIQGQSLIDADGVGITEDNEITISLEQAEVLYEVVSRALPRCWSVGYYGTVDAECQMPRGYCHTCVDEGRRIIKPIGGTQ